MASLYKGDLAPEVTEAMLVAKFCAACRILSTRVCRDTITRRSLNYGNISFKQPADAKRALDDMNFDVLKRCPIRIKRAPVHLDRPQSESWMPDMSLGLWEAC